MLENALKILEKMEENGFQAYIVGGFVRDYILGIESNDIDICTNARPKDVRSIFKDACLPTEEYGSITVILKNIRFEITTFRKEQSYSNYRQPDSIEFIDDLEEDLKRRDFLMNTLCIDKDGKVLDFFHGKKDIDEKIIHTVGDSSQKFSEDALRILRAIRFATVLNFTLSNEIKESIFKTKHLLKEISYQRKREELDRIFTSVNVKMGVHLLLELGLDYELELPNLDKVSNFDDLIGVWAQLNVSDLYPFTGNEKELIENIQKALSCNNLNHRVLYTYGLYVNSIAANIKGISKKDVTYQYNNLSIHSRGDIALNGDEISAILKKEPGPYLKEILKDLEEKILSLELENDKDQIRAYLVNYYL